MDRTFFSYAREDAEFVLGLARDLRAAGGDLWLDQLDIEPGERWDRAVEAALESCPRLLVVLSPTSVASTNVMDEVSYALEEGKRVVPVLIRACKIPFRLRRVQYIDLSTGYEQGLARLLEVLAEPVVPAEPAESGHAAEPAEAEAESRSPRPRQSAEPREPAAQRPVPSPSVAEPAGGRGTGRKVVVGLAAGLLIALGAFVVYRIVSGRPKPAPPEERADSPATVIDDIALPAYVFFDSAFAKKEQAQQRLVELNRWGYSNTGFFWVPNFKYLSGKPLYQVYVGPFAEKAEAETEICKYNRKLKTITYGVRLSTAPGREEIRCPRG